MALSKENSYFKVRVGEHNMDKKEDTEQDIAVEKVILHPKWNIETKNTSNGMKILTTHDIALIQLSSPVTFTSNVQSMCLDNGQPFKAGKKTLSEISLLRYWQTRTHCCGHIVAHDVSHVAQTGKHLLRTQNVSDQNQKHFLCPGHKICVRNKCCARGQTGKHLCRQQCVRNNVSSFASTFTPKNNPNKSRKQRFSINWSRSRVSSTD